MERFAVISGTGLIGSSIGMGLRAAGWRVSGWDPSSERLQQALALGAIDEALPVSPLLDTDADVIFLAGPVARITESLTGTATETLVTDVGSVKRSIVTAAAHLSHFVGGHPMAGGTTMGPAAASPGLFHGASWILTTDNTRDGDLVRVEEIVSLLGANPVRMTAAEHDERVARVSHLPHVVAAALTGLVHDDEGSVGLVGGGFRDMTRVASAESSWWTDVLVANSGEVSGAISELIERLEAWRLAITAGDTTATASYLTAARAQRLSVDDRQSSVRVLLRDEPGEIARVGRALEASGVDVRDFQLRHGEHGGGGVLTVTVHRGGEAPLTDALAAQGFEVLDEDHR